MYSFLFLLIPAITLTGIIEDKKHGTRSLILPAVTGIIAAIAVVMTREFFIFSDSRQTASFMEMTVNLSKATLIPSVLFALIFALLPMDSGSYKASAFFAACGFFYSGLIPYNAFASSEFTATSFILFVNPIMFAALLFILKFILANIMKFIEEKNIRCTCIHIGAFILACILPPIIQSLWSLKACGILWQFLAVIFACTPVALTKFPRNTEF